MSYQLYGVILAGVIVCFGLYYMLGRRKRIAQKVATTYGVSMEEYENMTKEEKQLLKKKKEETDI